MEVKKVYKPADTNNFENTRAYDMQTASCNTLSTKVLVASSKALTQKAKKQKSK